MAPQEARRDAAARPASAATVASPARQAIATRWEDIPDELVRDGVRRRGFGNDGVLLVMNELTPGMTVFPHVHEDFDQIATIVSGTAIYYVNGVGHEVGPGSLILIPAGQPHYIEPTGTEKVLNLDVFGPARKDLIHLLDWMKPR
ncbi:MAG TPA: cupin domain-containing protein [Candidatus Limnocylindria bacterium]|nr:cupin domain-containing protein [Candidatus Limnocylindria bacterium]